MQIQGFCGAPTGTGTGTGVKTATNVDLFEEAVEE